MYSFKSKLEVALYGLAIGENIGAQYEYRDISSKQRKNIKPIIRENCMGESLKMTLATCRCIQKDPQPRVGTIFEELDKVVKLSIESKGRSNISLSRIAPLAFLPYPFRASDKYISQVSELTHKNKDTSEICIYYVRLVQTLASTRIPPSYWEVLLATGDSGTAENTWRIVCECLHNCKDYKEALQWVLEYGGDSRITGAVVGVTAALKNQVTIPDEWCSIISNSFIGRAIEESLF